MNDFNFQMPKTGQIDLDEIHQMNYKKLYFQNDFSTLAHSLNNLILSDFSAKELSYDNLFFIDYEKIIKLFQISVKHLDNLQNQNKTQVCDLYKKLNKGRENFKKVHTQKNEIYAKISNMKEKIEEINNETQNYQEKIKEINYKYMCPECLKVNKNILLLFQEEKK